ncbi:MAG: hypothetical protein ACREJD_02910 [Phycisphaerales bacterium]
MDIPSPRNATLLSRLRIEHDPDKGIRGRRVLVQEGDGTWWAGRVTTYGNEGDRQVTKGSPGDTAVEAILSAISTYGEAT